MKTARAFRVCPFPKYIHVITTNQKTKMVNGISRNKTYFKFFFNQRISILNDVFADTEKN